MRTPYGFEVFDNCLTCRWRSDRFFCNFPEGTLKAFDAIAFTGVYPTGSILFSQGEPPRGIFMLCRGKAKLTTSSSTGKTLIARVADAGEVLGLSGCLSGLPYRLTAETLEPSQIKFAKREDFIEFLQLNASACFHAAAQLAQECHNSADHVRSLGLSHSAGEKLAHLLVSWMEDGGKPSNDGMRLKMLMTHQEISQMIGTSRETVTRLLGEFRHKNLITIRGSTLIIKEPDTLRAMVLL